MKALVQALMPENRTDSTDKQTEKGHAVAVRTNTDNSFRIDSFSVLNSVSSAIAASFTINATVNVTSAH
jgi:hypothetical protein